MKKSLLGILFVACISIVFLVNPHNVYATETEVFDTSKLDPVTQEIWTDMDKYITVEPSGKKVFNMAEASDNGESDLLLEMGKNFNNISSAMDENSQDTVKSLERMLLPIGSYGNYCGKGNRPGTNPIDNLDSACRTHDNCYARSGWGNKTCDRNFVRALLPIIQTTNATTYKYWYAVAAAKIFS